jgi:outer membrane immunogenic protein
VKRAGEAKGARSYCIRTPCLRISALAHKYDHDHDHKHDPDAQAAKQKEFEAKVTASAPEATSETFSQAGFPVLNSLANCGNLPCALSEPARRPTFRVAPYLGYNWQVAPQWVVGAEADFGFARRTTTLNGLNAPGTQGFGTGADTFVVKTSWDGSARLRAGYLVNPSVLVYATGGAGWMRIEATSNCGTPPFAFGVSLSNCTNFTPIGSNGELPPTIAHSGTQVGWTVGGGIEAGLWSNWVVRAEYRFSDYGTFSATDVRTCAAPCLFGPGAGAAAVITNNYDLHLRAHMANFGLAYKFGDPIPSVGAAAAPPRVVYKAPPPATAPSWAGAYIGFGIGLRATDTTATVTSDVVNNSGFISNPLVGCTTCFASEPLDDSSIRFSPYLGYLWQVDPLWVLGVEGDWGLAARTTTLNGMFYPSTIGVTFSASDTFAVKVDSDASVRARAGVLVTPGMLAYVTGGPSWLHVESTSTCSTTAFGRCAPGSGLSPAIITDSADRLGWTVGGGFEVVLWQNWRARGEYRYADYGTISHTDMRACPGCTVFGTPAPQSQSVSYDLRMRTHTATLGIAYKFGDWPVTAKY